MRGGVICANHNNQGNWYHRGNKCPFPFLDLSFWSHPPGEAQLVALLYLYGYICLCLLNKLVAILFQRGKIIHLNSQLKKTSTLITDFKHASVKSTTCHFWFRWIHISSILSCPPYPGGCIPCGKTAMAFYISLNVLLRFQTFPP